MRPRINKQIKELLTEGYTVQLLQKQGLKLVVGFRGPEGTPYEGGTFYVKFNIQKYPFKMPGVFMMTPTYHPLLGSCNNYEIGCCLLQASCSCLQHISKKGQWSFTHKIVKFMPHIIAFFKDPTANPEFWQTKFRMQSLQQYKRKAQLWTIKFAQKDNWQNSQENILASSSYDFKETNKKLNQDNECAICLEVCKPFQEEIKLGSDHVYHAKCIRSLKIKLCPLCRTQFD